MYFERIKAAVEHGDAAVVDVRGEALLHDLIEVKGFLRRSISMSGLFFSMLMMRNCFAVLRRLEGPTSPWRNTDSGGNCLGEGMSWHPFGILRMLF
jgi:hypothetical protein